MTAFPLIRVKWSNEHGMTCVFAVCILYLLPRWITNPSEILGFSVVLAAGLFIDVTANFIRSKKPVCAVSAAVTVTILECLTPGIPLWGRLAAITIALIAGKHLWGGTGKNGLNPAGLGYFLIALIFPSQTQIFEPTFILIPAILLSLLFIRYRPFAALSFFIGGLVALFMTRDFSLASTTTYGILFWAFIMFTDPVTITSDPFFCVLGGLLCGLLPFNYHAPAFVLPLCLLIFNVVSYFLSRLRIKPPRLRLTRLKLPSPFVQSSIDIPFFDLAESMDSDTPSVKLPTTQDEFLAAVQTCGIFGYGGAAFPTYDKLTTIIESNSTEKHLIINGAECDPGLIHDKWLMRRYPDEIYQGTLFLKEYIGFHSATLAVKDLTGLNYPTDLSIQRVPDFYPSGAEKLLIKQILGRQLSFDAIPAKEGILVLNVQTVYSIYQAVQYGKKADTRFITVADTRAKTASVAKVKIGDPIHKVINAVTQSNASYDVFCGGGAMQCHIANEDDVIDKKVNFIVSSEPPRYKESLNCSRCGRCTSICPSGLQVHDILDLAGKRNVDIRLNEYAKKCMQCGACSYICPAGRNLSARMHALR